MASDNDLERERTTKLVIELAGVAGVPLSEDRARLLAPQASEYFAVLRRLNDSDSKGSDIPSEYRLDRKVHST